MNIISNILNILKTVGWYFPAALPVISYFLGYIDLASLLVFDFLLVNPFLKGLMGILGLQSKRPVSECLDLSDYSCYGMPSGHTEVHWVFLFYLILELYQKYQNNEEISNKLIFGTVLVVLMTIIVMWQRWVTLRHTPKQIFWGAISGSLIASLFYMNQDLIAG